MQHILFGSDPALAEIAILIKTAAFAQSKIKAAYIDSQAAIPTDKFIAFDLAYKPNNKCPADFAKEYIVDLLPEIDILGITTLLVCDPNYFKYLTKNSKADAHYGYICPCAIDGYTHIDVILAPNYQAILYNPAIQTKLDTAVNAMVTHKGGSFVLPGTGIIHSAHYPDTITEIQKALKKLHQYSVLACDIEALSLQFWDAGISTIAFAWDKHNFIAFGVDRYNLDTDFNWRSEPNKQIVRELLQDFLITYKGTLIYHSANYDIKVLVYVLWMKNLSDYKGMINGIRCLTDRFEDSKLVLYLSTNNAVQNVLGLKEASASFTGNYAQEDIKDTSKIPFQQLLTYNGIDVLATNFIYDKYYPVMIADKQEQLYTDLFKPTVITLLQTELCGLPINPKKVQIAKAQLTAISNNCLDYFNNSKLIQDFHFTQLVALAAKKTAEAVKKVYDITDPIIAREIFNPNSDTQLRELIFDYMGYDVIDLTKGKQPSTSKDTIKKLLIRAKTPEHKEIFEYLIRLADVSIILSTFIPSFEQAQQLPDGSWRLYGNFNLGGTVSGRLSSSKPNLTNIPSHSSFAKIIKACFITAVGWVFAGADYHSLEAMISALTTQDKNKLKVYTDGMCSHCFNAFGYYKDQMPDINDTVASINSIKTKYPDLRQSSKTKTFLLTYGGTYHGLMSNEGLSKKDAKRIEKSYHTLYKESDDWVAAKIEQAKVDGYVIGAFGLRLRTPLLAKTVGKYKVPYPAKRESRTAGNMLGQSYGMLNTRAANEFIQRVWKSPYIYDILPVCQIHDSIYVMFRDDAKIGHWVNKNLIECMEWDHLKELKHPIVKLGAELDMFYPDWNYGATIPNNASLPQIKTICLQAEKEEKARKLIKP